MLIRNNTVLFKDKVYMSNLCPEITLPTYPLQHIDDENGEIVLVLKCTHVGTIKDLDDLEELCELAVRVLELLTIKDIHT